MSVFLCVVIGDTFLCSVFPRRIWRSFDYDRIFCRLVSMVHIDQDIEAIIANIRIIATKPTTSTDTETNTTTLDGTDDDDNEGEQFPKNGCNINHRHRFAIFKFWQNAGTTPINWYLVALIDTRYSSLAPTTPDNHNHHRRHYRCDDVRKGRFPTLHPHPYTAIGTPASMWPPKNAYFSTTISPMSNLLMCGLLPWTISQTPTMVVGTVLHYHHQQKNKRNDDDTAWRTSFDAPLSSSTLHWTNYNWKEGIEAKSKQTYGKRWLDLARYYDMARWWDCKRYTNSKWCHLKFINGYSKKEWFTWKKSPKTQSSITLFPIEKAGTIYNTIVVFPNEFFWTYFQLDTNCYWQILSFYKRW